MSKIKLRNKDIKLRGRENLTTKAVRRINIKARAKNTKPTVQEDQSAEADAVAAGTEITVSMAHRVSSLKKRTARKGQKKHTVNAAHNDAPEPPEPPPVFSRLSQKITRIFLYIPLPQKQLPQYSLQKPHPKP